MSRFPELIGVARLNTYHGAEARRLRDSSASLGTGSKAGGRRYRLFVDSRTTSSGATLRWVAVISRFSSTALIPSSTTPTAEAPIVSIGWRTVVSDGV